MRMQDKASAWMGDEEVDYSAYPAVGMYVGMFLCVHVGIVWIACIVVVDCVDCVLYVLYVLYVLLFFVCMMYADDGCMMDVWWMYDGCMMEGVCVEVIPR